MDFSTYAARTAPSTKQPYIAVVPIAGEVMRGITGRSGGIYGDEVQQTLQNLLKDRQARGIVLRVTSPGGVMEASETISRQVALCREAGKPVVVSMGSVAASGGYYLSSHASHILATPYTITGSIGVVLIYPNLAGLAKLLGVNIDFIKKGELAALYGLYGYAFTEKDIEALNKLMDFNYDCFVKHVASGRSLSLDEVEKVAGGRAWIGKDALDAKLVDELGGLSEAIRRCKSLVAQKTRVKESYLSISALTAERAAKQKAFQEAMAAVKVQQMLDVEKERAAVASSGGKSPVPLTPKPKQSNEKAIADLVLSARRIETEMQQLDQQIAEIRYRALAASKATNNDGSDDERLVVKVTKNKPDPLSGMLKKVLGGFGTISSSQRPTIQQMFSELLAELGFDEPGQAKVKALYVPYSTPATMTSTTRKDQ